MKIKAIYIQRMIDAIDQIFIYLEGKTKYDFERETMLHDACLMQFQHLGETASKLHASFPEEDRLPFAHIIAFRNLIAHEYLGIESARVYEIAHAELPGLRVTLTQII